MAENDGKTEMVEPQPPAEAEPKTQVDAAPKADELQAELDKARKALKDANKEAAERRKKLEEYEQAEAKRKQAEMTEAERAQARIKELEAQAAEQAQQIKQSERRELQRKVAEAVGIPAVLASRIAGDTEEAMTEDAKAILDALPKAEAKGPKAPHLNATNPADGQKSETLAQKKERLGMLNNGDIFKDGEVIFIEKE